MKSKLPWTSDPYEIERRMIKAGLLKPITLKQVLTLPKPKK